MEPYEGSVMQVSHKEWLNDNMYRSYPFSEGASLKPAPPASQVSVPDYLVTDMVLTVPSNKTFTASLSVLTLVGDFLTLIFSDDSGNHICSMSASVSGHEENSAYRLAPADDYVTANGKIVIGDLQRFVNEFPDGSYSFTGAELESCVVRPDLQGVSTMTVVNGSTRSLPLYGDINLIEGSNIRLTYIPGLNGIRIDAIDSSGFNNPCDPGGDGGDGDVGDGGGSTTTFISTINGVAAEDVTIVGDGKCVTVTTSGNQITISDTCSTPCCGCEELNFVLNHLEILQSTLARLDQYSIQLQYNTGNLINSMLGTTGGANCPTITEAVERVTEEAPDIFTAVMPPGWQDLP
jgi:hypothetical protein